MDDNELNKFINDNQLVKRVLLDLECMDKLYVNYVLRNKKIEDVIKKNILFFNKRNSIYIKGSDDFLEWFLSNIKKTIYEIERGYSEEIKKNNFIKALKNES